IPRADGPVMPSPRAGMAMVRESSSHTTVRARTDMPPPPYSVGTSSCQMPSSLARPSKRSRYSGLICSPSVDSRSIGISSLSTKRRKVALRIRSSSGNSKSIALCFLRALLPQHPHVDGDRARCDRVRCGGALVGSHDQRIDLDLLYPGSMIQEEPAERECGGFERRAIGGGPAAKAGEASRQFQAVDHRTHLLGGYWKQAQCCVLDELDQHATRADEQQRAVEGVVARADDRLEADDHLLDEKALDPRGGLRSAGRQRLGGHFNCIAVMQIERNAADFGLVQNIARANLQRDGKADTLGRARGLGGGRNGLAFRQRDAVARKRCVQCCRRKIAGRGR